MELFISSKNKTSGTINNFNIISDYPFVQKYTKIKLLEASIPISFNNTAGGTFDVIGSISGTNTITIPADRYSITSLAASVQSLLNAGTGQTYTVSGDIGGKLTIASSTETFQLDFTGSAVSDLLGFTGVSAIVSIITGTSITSVLRGDTHICICSAQVSGIDNGIVVYKATTTNNHIIHAVPICGDFINYRSDDYDDWVKINPDIIPYNFYLTFTDGTPIDLNGADWSMKILLR